MNRYGYVRAETVQDAVAALAGDNAYALAGGTNLVDLMKYDVEKPSTLVDITRLPLNTITETEDGGLMLGALTLNADTAYDERVARRYPLLASAILAGSVAAAAQRRHRRRQPPAAHEVLLLLRPVHPLQQA